MKGRGRERGEEGCGGGAVGYFHTRCLCVCVCVCACVRACGGCVVFVPEIPPPPGTSGDRSEEDLSILIMPSSITPLISMTSADSCKGRTNILVVKGDTTVRVEAGTSFHSGRQCLEHEREILQVIKQIVLLNVVVLHKSTLLPILMEIKEKGVEKRRFLVVEVENWNHFRVQK